MQDKFAGRNFDAEASRDEIGQSAMETDRESDDKQRYHVIPLEVGNRRPANQDFDRLTEAGERKRKREMSKGDFQTSKRDVLQQPTTACIMQVVGNGRMRNVCRADAASEVNLMRPTQKEREQTNEWPNERCASGLRDFPEEISKRRRLGRAPIWTTDRFALDLLVRFRSLQSETSKKPEIL